jgi:hypothetical protein
VLLIQGMVWIQDSSKSLHGKISLERLHKTRISMCLSVSAHMEADPRELHDLILSFEGRAMELKLRRETSYVTIKNFYQPLQVCRIALDLLFSPVCRT